MAARETSSIVDLFAISISERAQARARLREMLGERLGIDAALVPIVEAEGGKPRLEPDAGLADLRFNLSHSGERALIAIAEGVELGVDVERVTPKRSPKHLGDWTRREAYLKGRGTGLRGGPRGVSFEAAGAHLAVIDHGERIAGWRVVDLDIREGYVAALAADSEVDVRVRLDPALAQSA